MCGIAGQSGVVDRSTIERMTRSLAHRGPDGSGVWVSPRGGSGLGHRRLAIIDTTDGGAQPMVDPTTGSALAFNGEIYNHAELRRRLQANGVRFRSESDTEVLLQLLVAEGLAGLRRVRGIYAFAWVDASSDRTYLVRDRLGVKPLYYAGTGCGVSFASELKAVLADPHVDRALDQESVLRTVTYLWTPSPATLLRSCRKVPPGHVLALQDGQIASLQELPALDSSPSPEMTDPGTTRSAVAERFRSAVERQMVSDVPVGTFLSGGMDSTAVTSIARTHPTFTVAYTIGAQGQGALESEGFTDDLPYAVAAARCLNVELRVVEAPRLTSENLSWFTSTLDEVHADPAALLSYAICEQARADGVKVLLGGSGGDDLFTGYRRHRAVRLLQNIDRIPLPVRSSAARLGSRVRTDRPFARRAGKLLAQLPGSPTDRLVGLFQWLPAETLDGLRLGTHRDTRELVEAPLRDHLATLPPGTGVMRQALHLEQRFFLGDHNLGYLDKTSMAAGVELRVPFLDEDLAATAAAIPADVLMPGGRPKGLLNAALGPLVPASVRSRPKTGFGAPLRVTLERDLGTAFDTLLGPEVVARRGLFDPQAVEALRTSTRTGQTDGSYSLLALALIESWCRTFVDSCQRTEPLEAEGCW